LNQNPLIDLVEHACQHFRINFVFILSAVDELALLLDEIRFGHGSPVSGAQWASREWIERIF
jgi:hypothetical protein